MIDLQKNNAPKPLDDNGKMDDSGKKTVQTTAKTKARQTLRKTIGTTIENIVTPLVVQGRRADRLISQNKQFKTFMHAIPLDYVGWSRSGVGVVSPNFQSNFGLDNLRGFKDVMSLFAYESRIDLQDAYEKLKENNREFNLILKCAKSDNVYEVIGAVATLNPKDDIFYVLWFRDITDTYQGLFEKESVINHLKRAEVLYQSSFEGFPFPLWIRNEYGEIFWCNKAYARIFDMIPAQLIQQQKELFPDGRSRDLAENAFKAGRTQVIKDHIVVEGDRRFVEVREIPLPESTQNLGYLWDLTEQERLEQELKTLSDANSEVLGQINLPVAIFNKDTSLEFYNRGYQKLWQLSEKWLDTKPRLNEILNRMRDNRRLPEQVDFRKYVQHWQGLFTSIIDTHEEMVFLPDGTALRMVVVPHPKGGIMVTFEDVTSRLELESSYNTLIAVQKETIDNLAEGVSVFGVDGRLKLYNKVYKKIWRLNDGNLANEPHISELVEFVSEFFEKSEWPEIKEKLVSSCVARTSKTGRFMRKDGTILDYALVPLPDGALLCSYVDVTDTVNVEQALREKNIALEETDTLKAGFLANVSYQLRTPLNALVGFADILNQEYFGPVNEKQQEYVQGILQAGGRLVSLIDDILDLSTIQAGYLALNYEEITIKDMIASLEEMVQSLNPDKKLSLTFSLKKDLGKATLDERRIRQVLMNLIKNAVQNTPKAGQVTLEVSRQKGHIVFIVTDNGRGITEEQMQQIFKPFARMERSKEQQGAGIGLSLVKSIVDLHQGTLDIQSQVGEGTVVTVIIPADSPV